MSVQGISLSDEQLAFLEDNFVVYDPEARKCYEEFGRLNECQVILIGEIHDTEVLSRIHKAFLKLFTQESSCVLVEYLSSEESIKKEKIPGWEDLPETLSILGSDVRRVWTAQQVEKWLPMEAEITLLLLKKKEEFLRHVRLCAQLLNNNVLSYRAKIIEEQGILEISKATQQELRDIQDKVMQTLSKYNERINSLENKIKQIDLINPYLINVLQANQGMLAQIKKVSKQYQKIFGIWGIGHFTGDDGFYTELVRSNISYIILLPNGKRMAEAVEERRWRFDAMARISLKVRSETIIRTELLPNGQLKTISNVESSKLLIPEVFRSFFHPSIQTLFKDENPEPKPIILNTESFFDLCKQGNVVTFPANIPIHFENFDTFNFQSLKNLLTDTKGKRIPMGKEALKGTHRHLISGIDNMLLFCNHSVKSIDLPRNLALETTYSKTHQPVLEIMHNQPWVLTLDDSKLVTSAAYLLMEMKRRGLEEFNILPKQRLYFRDLTPTEIDTIIVNPKKALFEWLSSKTPSQTEVGVSENIQVNRATALTTNDSEPVEGIVLYAEEGFKIFLNRKYDL